MKNNNSYFVLFASCVAVNGVSRSLICDLQRDELFFIPNDFFDILSLSHKTKISDLYLEYDKESRSIMDDYFFYLEKNELGFFTDYPELFPAISENWDSPELITNAIIDRNKESTYNLLNAIQAIAELQCKFIQFRIYDEFPQDQFENLLDFIDRKDQIISVEIILKLSSYINEEYLKKKVKHYPKIKTLIIHSVEQSKVVQLFSEKERGKMGNIIFTSTVIDSDLHCGVIDQMAAKSLNNVDSYIEALHFNSCLNKKVGIDVHGSIKNCPSMPQSFGNIEKDNLKQIILQEIFQKNWNITKDQVSTCNICEFRRVCSDCRAFTEDNTLLSKPKKCNYDPYTTSWE